MPAALMTFEGRNLPSQTIEHCVDADTDKLMNSVSGNMRQNACSKQDTQKVDATIGSIPSARSQTAR